MKGTQSKQVEVLHRAIQDYLGGVSLGDLTEGQASLLDKLMVDGGIVCSHTLDAGVIQIQEDFLVDKDISTAASKLIELLGLTNG